MKKPAEDCSRAGDGVWKPQQSVMRRVVKLKAHPDQGGHAGHRGSGLGTFGQDLPLELGVVAPTGSLFKAYGSTSPRESPG